MSESGPRSSHCTHWTPDGERCCECDQTFLTKQEAWRSECQPATRPAGIYTARAGYTPRRRSS